VTPAYKVCDRTSDCYGLICPDSTYPSCQNGVCRCGADSTAQVNPAAQINCGGDSTLCKAPGVTCPAGKRVRCGRIITNPEGQQIMCVCEE
jgi:hypothetical protein